MKEELKMRGKSRFGDVIGEAFLNVPFINVSLHLDLVQADSRVELKKRVEERTKFGWRPYAAVWQYRTVETNQYSQALYRFSSLDYLGRIVIL